MVRRGDHHGVDILSGEDFPKVVVGCAVFVLVPLVDHALGLVAAAFEDVAGGEYPRVLLAQVHIEVAMNPMSSSSNKSNSDLIAWSVFTQNTSWNNCRECNCCWYCAAMLYEISSRLH